ncbi:MAG: sensor histidine kinase [Gammaproteobacteria bacterium]
MSVLSSDLAKVKRLRGLLLLFFMILMLPVGALLFFAFQQMKWEIYHQYREQAEALAERINQQLTALVNQENLRPSTDYRFLSARQSNGSVQLTPSPLSRLPASLGIAGLVGYFQIGPNGQFTTPLMPDNTDHDLSNEQLRARRAISAAIQEILVNERTDIRKDESYSTTAEAPEQDQLTARDSESDRPGDFVASTESTAKSTTGMAKLYLRKDSIAQFDDKAKKNYQSNRQRLGSVAELELDDSLAQKAEQIVPAPSATARFQQPESSTAESKSRKEKVTTYELASPPIAVPNERDLARRENGKRRAEAAIDSTIPSNIDHDQDVAEAFAPSADAGAELMEPENPAGAMLRSRDAGTSGKFATIKGFETEVEYLRLSIFDDEHLVIHRNVWQQSERYIQGFVIRREEFVKNFIESAFYGTSLASMSQLLVAMNDDVLNIFSTPDNSRYTSSPGSLTGTVLFQRDLVSPFNGFSLIFNITELPLGTSIRYLAWVTAIMLIVMLAGLYIIYRYGKRQVALLRQQQDFVSAVSHELKTPLTSIRMYSEMLKNGWAAEEKHQDYYQYIHSESERLSRLIENVLQLARINRKPTRLKLESINVGELISNALSTITSLADAADFEIEESLAQAALDCTLQTSSDAAMQIILNIADNAVKFSRNAEIKKICLRVDLQNDGGLEIGIRDFGPGIDQSQMKKIFELFYRSENELTRETVGTGIGLALVHELARNMGATVDIRHCKPGVEFTIKWPAALVNQKGRK